MSVSWTAVNILASYFLWILVTVLLRAKIKSLVVYALFPLALYSVPCVYYYFKTSSALYVAPVAVSIVLLVLVSRFKRADSVFLIPLPQVLTVVFKELAEVGLP